MRAIKYRQPVYYNGDFSHFYYWGWLRADEFTPPRDPYNTNGVYGDAFTCLHDKNGREVYEGDIVIEVGKATYVIQWLEDRAAFGGRTDTATILLYGFHGKVIGDIYQNPELLNNG